MKIWCFELHLALVSCQYPDFSRNGSHLKKSVGKVEFLHWAKLVNFQHFQLFEKNAWLWEAVVSKPLNPKETKGYQWKDNVHIFHLIPSGALCDHWSGHRDALKTGPILYKNFFLQRVDGFPYVEASMVLIAKRTNSDSQNLSAFQRNTRKVNQSPWKVVKFSTTSTSKTYLAIWKSMILCVTEKNRMILYVTESMILNVTEKICMILYVTSRVWYNMLDAMCTSLLSLNSSIFMIDDDPLQYWTTGHLLR